VLSFIHLLSSQKLSKRLAKVLLSLFFFGSPRRRRREGAVSALFLGYQEPSKRPAQVLHCLASRVVILPLSELPS
jgi:hypothetical protein